MRARNIKPAFFTDENIVGLSFAERLLFIGLWCEADRAGRLEDRPRQLQIRLFPCDQVDVDAMLDRLQQDGLILRYESDGARYIQVVHFTKHQKPHKNESESVIPEPELDTPKPTKSTTMAASEHNHGCVEDEPRSLPLGLIEDRGKRIADRGLLIEEERLSSPEPADAPGKPDLHGLVDAFHELCPSLPRILVLKDSRKQRLIKAHKQLGTEGLREMFARVEASDFLAGRQKDWRADFDWILKPEHIPKILEGSYDNRRTMRSNVNQALSIAERLEREEAQGVTV